MMRTLASVAEVVEGRLIGVDAAFGPVSTDTRHDVSGSLYVALGGENFDGNQFIEAAAAGGAVGALVSRPADIQLSQIAVDDTRQAFAKMAHNWRKNFSVPLVAVTGSSGKTTVKTMLSAIFGVDRKVCVTEGNLNNEIGVPITLMRMAADDDVAILELGANHAGEIDFLAGLVQPNVVLITNAGAAHLEGFGSIDGVVRAKGELLDHIEPGGAAILNRDDHYFDQWKARAGAARIIEFGVDSQDGCCVKGEIQLGHAKTNFRLQLPDGQSADVSLALLGIHNVRNALAAAAAAFAVGVGIDQIAEGLSSIQAVSGRLASVTGLNGVRIIDDSYNANPSSVRAALDSLEVLPGKRIFVLGDMGELGKSAVEHHREIGRYAVGRCDEFISVGELASAATEAFGSNAFAFVDLEAAADAISPKLSADVTLMIKASRSMQLDRLVALLQQVDQFGGEPC